jgi:hypothetical protein
MSLEHPVIEIDGRDAKSYCLYSPFFAGFFKLVAKAS